MIKIDGTLYKCMADAAPLFSTAKSILLRDMPYLESLPDFPMAEDVHLENIPKLKHVPACPAAKIVCLFNLLVTELPEFPGIIDLHIENLPLLEEIQDFHLGMRFWIKNISPINYKIIADLDKSKN